MLIKIFLTSLISFLVIYFLRGVGILSFLPGGIILLLLTVSLGSGLTWGIKKTTRF